MMLYVTCNDCGEEIPTGISIGFAGKPVLGAHTYICRSCGTEDEYRGDDYHVAPRENTAGSADS